MRLIFLLAFLSPCLSQDSSSIDYNALAPLQSISNQEELNDYLKKNIESLLTIGSDELSFIVYRNSSPNGANVKFTDVNRLTELSSFNTSVKTVVYVHGWMNPVDGAHVTPVRDALLQASDYNVLLVDWDSCALDLNYLRSWGCVEVTGKYLGQALSTIRDTFNYSLDMVTVSGHSLGAHIAGYTGKNTEGTLGVIVGLDPAGPLFFKSEPAHRLNSTDAQFVQAIHTGSQFFGLNYKVADADFWPNGGHFQPGCIELLGLCSHYRAYQYYAESVIYNDFIGRKCGNYGDFKQGDCDGNMAGHMGGLDIDTSINGDFYLTTNGNPPYGQA